ncbi:MAG: hypothetical protein HOH43_08010 [Candidatus Latescibacteria bacterium]|nr:hypothetical protein [Candidatus Latescibacterota bacterium]
MEICEIEFKGRRKETYINSRNVPVLTGDYVIVEVERGEHIGRVSEVRNGERPSEAKHTILREGTAADREKMIKNKFKETEALKIARERVQERNLEMKLTDVEYQFDGNKISFYFTAEQRIDFRELVRSLASVYRTRIDMRQIGARDEAKRSTCAVGSCGRPLCCGSFLEEFKTVTTDMVTQQRLTRTPAKLLGSCGRLKCCLLYEAGFHEEDGKRYPKVGAEITTENGPCTVEKIDLVDDSITVQYESGALERISRSRLGSGDCGGGKCHQVAPEPAHAEV